MVINNKLSAERSGYDRRLGPERRMSFDLKHLDKLGQDRRKSERRRDEEKRNGWIRYTQWSSVCIESILA